MSCTPILIRHMFTGMSTLYFFCFLLCQLAIPFWPWLQDTICSLRKIIDQTCWCPFETAKEAHSVVKRHAMRIVNRRLVISNIASVLKLFLVFWVVIPLPSIFLTSLRMGLMMIMDNRLRRVTASINGSYRKRKKIWWISRDQVVVV